MFFRNQYWFLSNMYPCVIEYNGITYSCAEAAFQAQKSPERAQEFSGINGFEAKRLGRKVDLVTGWDVNKDRIMADIVRAKFCQNKDLARRLLETENEELVEDNTWNDYYWGRCRGHGQNKLGLILMSIRKELRQIYQSAT